MIKHPYFFNGVVIGGFFGIMALIFNAIIPSLYFLDPFSVGAAVTIGFWLGKGVL